MFTEILNNLFNIQTFIGLMIGIIGGMIIGVLPGLTATMGIALLIPFTFGMQATAGLVMLTSVYAAACYGGAFLAILVCTPGTPANAATAIDGYALTQQGKGLQAIGVATIASMVGGSSSALVLLFVSPPLAYLSVKFNAPEYFLIAIFGLTIIGSLAGDNMLKGLIAGTFGLCIAFVGYDAIMGVPRFTYKIMYLESGIQLVPALIGLFSISQVLMLAENIQAIRRGEKIELPSVSGKVLPSFPEVINAIPTLIRSVVIGLIIGILPGPGADVGGWISYNEAKRWSKKRHLFGKGAMEAIWASESANNATASGSIIPTITLGIPGSAAAAVLLGGFMIKGLTPGFTLFTEHGGTTYAILLGYLAANIIMGFFGLLVAKRLARLANVPIGILSPAIIVLSVVGAYAINLSFFDVGVMIVFGLIGYFMRKTGFPTAPVVLAIILCSLAEQSYHRAILMAKDTNIFVYYFSRPICVVLVFLIILALFTPLIFKIMEKKMSKV